ncbi:MAG: four-carbon acid sugar kinase family protein [Cereibacter changlensis]
MAYIFVADDFTGASDTLATLARAGLRARLFRELPAAGDTDGLEAWGIATPARSLGRVAMAALAARLGAGLAPYAPDFLHVKICSTFDSSPEIGNFVLLGQGLADALGQADLAILGGQPSLGRHSIFGTLFARGPDGQVHRIDRHPVMSAHPVTPMHEADLIRHLASLGLSGVHRVGRGQRGQAFPRFYDLLDQTDVAAAGLDLRASRQRLVVLGASSVAEAWLATRPPRPEIARPRQAATGPVFAFAGSRSSLTTAQIGAADGLARRPLAPMDLIADRREVDLVVTWARERLERGQDCIVYLTADDAEGVSPADLAQRGAEFVASVVATAPVGGLLVAGGDTSSAIVNSLAPAWLDYAGDLCAGVPILRAQIDGIGLAMALKGGQMGDRDFFARAVAVMRGN